MSDAEVSLTAYHHIVATRCLTFAGFTMLLYDHLTTLPEEIAQVWSRPKNAVSLMFLFNRYLTPLILMVDLYGNSGLASPLTRSFCTIWLLLEGYLVVLVFSIIHALVAMRVCALYEQKTWIVILLGSSLIAYVASMLVLVTIGLVPMSRHIRPFQPFNFCFATLTTGLWVVWLPSLLFESLIFFLTIVRVVQYICRDVYMPSIIYFLAMGTVSLFCLLDWLVAPATLNGLVKHFGYAACVCASSKLVLNLRALAPGNDVWTVSYEFPDSETTPAPALTSSRAPSPQPAVIHDHTYIETVRTLPRVATGRRTRGSLYFAPWLVPTQSSDLYHRLCVNPSVPPPENMVECDIPMADFHAPCDANGFEPTTSDF